MPDLHSRVDAAEAAVIALAAQEFGDQPGHEFRGNQHSLGGGPSAASSNGRINRVDAAAKMYGTGSREHQEAIKRWGASPPQKHEADNADREARQRETVKDD